MSVVRLQVAPVKGLAALPRDEIWLDEDGVAEDRRILLLHADGSVVTMRARPELVRVLPELDLDAGSLTIRLPDGTSATSALGDVRGSAASVLFRKHRAGQLLPGDVADALSAFAGEPLRVLVADRTGVGWDEGPVSLISRASAAAVDSPDDGDGLARYRMLIEVDGCAPFEEDTWAGRTLSVGEATLQISHSLARCVVINHSPVSGGQDWNGLKTLAARRGELTLGVIAHVSRPGAVAVGDLVIAH